MNGALLHNCMESIYIHQILDRVNYFIFNLEFNNNTFSYSLRAILWGTLRCRFIENVKLILIIVVIQKMYVKPILHSAFFGLRLVREFALGTLKTFFFMRQMQSVICFFN